MGSIGTMIGDGSIHPLLTKRELQYAGLVGIG